MTPPRVQQRRGKPLPAGVRSCARPSRWGNPYRVGVLCEAGDVPDVETAVRLFRTYAADRLRREPGWLDPLRGAAGLACYCGPAGPCHVDVIRELLAAGEGGPHG